MITILEFTRSYANRLTIRDTARAIGHIVSSMPAVAYGGFHYRLLEAEKYEA